MRPPLRQGAFSLIEILVACAIMMMLLVALLGIANSTLNFTKLSQRKMDSTGSLRAAMDRMSVDLGAVVRRGDLPPLFLTQPAGNDEIYLRVQADGYGGDRGLSIIGYRIHEGKLERGAQGTGWTTNRLGFAEPLSTNLIAAENFDVVGDRIFRMKVEFLGTNGAFLTNVVSRTNWNDLSAVVINMATVDKRARQLSSATPDQWAELLPTQATDPQKGIFHDWSEALKSPNFFQGDAMISSEARRGIEIRRRIISLPK